MSDPQRSDPALPGQDLIERGLLDFARGSESTEALLVSIGAPRLRRIGLTVPPGFADAERGGSMRGSPSPVATRRTAVTTPWCGGLSASSGSPNAPEPTR